MYLAFGFHTHRQDLNESPSKKEGKYQRFCPVSG